MMMKEYLEIERTLRGVGVEKKKDPNYEPEIPTRDDAGYEHDLVIGAIFYCCLVTSVSHQICLV